MEMFFLPGSWQVGIQSDCEITGLVSTIFNPVYLHRGFYVVKTKRIGKHLDHMLLKLLHC